MPTANLIQPNCRRENERATQFGKNFQKVCRIRNSQFLLGCVENVQFILQIILQFLFYLLKFTFGAVAAASKGNKPPEAITRLSVSWEMIWIVLAMKI